MKKSEQEIVAEVMGLFDQWSYRSDVHPVSIVSAADTLAKYFKELFEEGESVLLSKADDPDV